MSSTALPMHPDKRRIVIAGSVVLVHVLLLWALQSGLMRRAVETLVPGEILTAMISEPAPPAPQPQTPRAAPTPKVAPQVTQKAPTPPTPVLSPEPAPAPVPVAAPAAAMAPAIDASAVAATAAAPAAPVRYEQPSSSAAYLNNAKPTYPALSKRLGEQGTVIVSVLIGVDGTAQQVQIKRSSGYERLDQAALATTRSWRYVPAKRNGVPEATTWDVPIKFVLE